MDRHAPGDPEAERAPQAGVRWVLSPGNRRPGTGVARGPAVYSLAAVGVEDSTEEFHAHDGKGVVEDEQGEAQAGEEGQRDRVTQGQAGEPASSGSPASSDPRS